MTYAEAVGEPYALTTVILYVVVDWVVWLEDDEDVDDDVDDVVELEVVEEVDDGVGLGDGVGVGVELVSVTAAKTAFIV